MFERGAPVTIDTFGFGQGIARFPQFVKGVVVEDKGAYVRATVDGKTRDFERERLKRAGKAKHPPPTKTEPTKKKKAVEPPKPKPPAEPKPPKPPAEPKPPKPSKPSKPPAEPKPPKPKAVRCSNDHFPPGQPVKIDTTGFGQGIPHFPKIALGVVIEDQGAFVKCKVDGKTRNFERMRVKCHGAVPKTFVPPVSKEEREEQKRLRAEAREADRKARKDAKAEEKREKAAAREAQKQERRDAKQAEQERLDAEREEKYQARLSAKKAEEDRIRAAREGKLAEREEQSKKEAEDRRLRQTFQPGSVVWVEVGDMEGFDGKKWVSGVVTNTQAEQRKSKKVTVRVYKSKNGKYDHWKVKFSLSKVKMSVKKRAKTTERVLRKLRPEHKEERQKREARRQQSAAERKMIAERKSSRVAQRKKEREEAEAAEAAGGEGEEAFVRIEKRPKLRILDDDEEDALKPKEPKESEADAKKRKKLESDAKAAARELKGLGLDSMWHGGDKFVPKERAPTRSLESIAKIAKRGLKKKAEEAKRMSTAETLPENEGHEYLVVAAAPVKEDGSYGDVTVYPVYIDGPVNRVNAPVRDLDLYKMDRPELEEGDNKEMLTYALKKAVKMLSQNLEDKKSGLSPRHQQPLFLGRGILSFSYDHWKNPEEYMSAWSYMRLNWDWSFDKRVIPVMQRLVTKVFPKDKIPDHDELYDDWYNIIEGTHDAASLRLARLHNPALPNVVARPVKPPEGMEYRGFKLVDKDKSLHTKVFEDPAQKGVTRHEVWDKGVRQDVYYTVKRKGKVVRISTARHSNVEHGDASKEFDSGPFRKAPTRKKKLSEVECGVGPDGKPYRPKNEKERMDCEMGWRPWHDKPLPRATKAYYTKLGVYEGTTEEIESQLLARKKDVENKPVTRQQVKRAVFG